MRISNVIRSASSGQECQMSNPQRGFTLIELLAVIAVLIVVGIFIGVILFSSLTVTNKTNTLTTVRQNGNHAISQISKMVRDAKILNSPYPCVTPPSPTPVATRSSITITSYDEGKTTFICEYTLPDSTTTIASQSGTNPPLSLLDTSAVSLAPGSCSFTCSQDSSSDAPRISIKFMLTQRSSSLFPEQQASLNFETSVTIRSVGR